MITAPLNPITRIEEATEIEATTAVETEVVCIEAQVP